MKKKIVVAICGGLGNQLFQYAAACNTNRKILCDISSYAQDDLREYVLNNYSITGSVMSGRRYLILRKWLQFCQRISFLICKNNKNYIFKERESYKYYDLSEAVIIDGYWQNMAYFRDVRPRLIKEFTYMGEYPPDIIDYVNAIESSNSVALHIRKTDYLSPANAGKYYDIPMKYYDDAIRFISDKVCNPLFFIFSDDIEWCKEKLCYLEHRLIFIDQKSSDIIEFELMRKCKFFIIANSTYSWWASYLSLYESKLIVAPKQWLVDKDNNQKLLNALIDDSIYLL